MDYSVYFAKNTPPKKKLNLSVFLQLGFIIIGALLIIASAFLLDNEPQKADAVLFSPVSTEEKEQKDFFYKLVYADPKRFIYKETTSVSQSLKVVNISTNLSETITNSKRCAFVGFLNDTTFLYAVDEDGLNRFTVFEYNLEEKTNNPFLAFTTLWELNETELDGLITISPDKTRLAITHQSGIVVYTIKNEKEATVLENSKCENQESCFSYRNPKWVNNNNLLVKQLSGSIFNYLTVDTNGTILSVLPQNFADLSINTNSSGLPFVGVTDAGLHLIEPKKTSLVISAKEDTIFTHPIWFGANQILSFAQVSGVPTIVRTDKTGKKVISLAEFPAKTQLSDLITGPENKNMYFLSQTKDDNHINVSFFQMKEEEDKPQSFYSISKNL